MSEETATLAKLFGGGGAFAALLYLLFLVGSRMVAAIDRVAQTVTTQGAATAATLNEQGQAIVRVETLLETALGIAPPPPPPRARTGRTPADGVPSGFYSQVARR